MQAFRGGINLKEYGSLAAVQGGEGFTPLDLPDLSLWLDASDISSLYQDSAATTSASSDNDPVGRWSDKSGNTRHAVQATGADRPILKLAIKNGLPVVRFVSSDNLVSTFGADLPQPNTVVIVAKKDAADGNYYFDGIDAAKRHLLYQSSPQMLAPTVLVAAGVTVTNWNIYTLLFNTTSGDLRANGSSAAAGDVGAHVLSGLTVGAAFNFSGGLLGDIAEIIVYHRLLSSEEIATIETYANGKWSVF